MAYCVGGFVFVVCLGFFGFVFVVVLCGGGGYCCDFCLFVLFLWVCFVFPWVFSYGINRISMIKDLRNLTHPAPMGTLDAGLI